MDDAVKKTQEQLTEIGESGQKALAELGTDLKGREKLSAEAHLNKFTGGGHADMRP